MGMRIILKNFQYEIILTLQIWYYLPLTHSIKSIMQMNFPSFAVITGLFHEQDIIKAIQNGNYFNLIRYLNILLGCIFRRHLI